jgi:biopolymer transport protein ExbD
MPIETPGKRFGLRLQRSRVFGKHGHGKRTVVADLLITPLVDMFVIIVIFLLQSFSASGEILFMSKDIVLPSAKNGSEIDRAAIIQVSSDAVMVEGQQIALLADLGRDEYWNIPALEDKLRDLKKRYELVHSGTSDVFKGDINIQAHKNIDFKIIKRVSYSCNQAGYLTINYATLTSGE